MTGRIAAPVRYSREYPGAPGVALSGPVREAEECHQWSRRYILKQISAVCHGGGDVTAWLFVTVRGV